MHTIGGVGTHTIGGVGTHMIEQNKSQEDQSQKIIRTLSPPSLKTHTTAHNTQASQREKIFKPSTISTLHPQPSRWTRGGNPTRTAQQASTPQAVSIARTKEG